MHLFREQAAPNMDEAGALERLGAEVRGACERIGCFFVQNHGIPQDLIDRTFEQTKRLFSLPLEEKLKVKLDQYNLGYQEMNASAFRDEAAREVARPNQSDSFFVTFDRSPDHPDCVARTPLRGGNYWPDDLPGFRECAMDYFHAAQGLGQRMLPAFAVALDLHPDFFAPLFTEENHATLRLAHYPPTKLEGTDFGMGPHMDVGFLTLLARMEVPGLAVQLPSGEWVTPPLIPGTLLVVIGTLLQRMSNDRFRPPPHGVIVEGDKDRYSLAYFHSPHPYCTIEVMPTCTDADSPPKYKPALHADLIMEAFRAIY